MALKLIDHGSKDYSLMIALRHSLLRKPLGLSFSDEELKNEVNDILLGCFDDGKAGRLLPAYKNRYRNIAVKANGCCIRLAGKRCGKSFITVWRKYCAGQRLQKNYNACAQNGYRFLRKMRLQLLQSNEFEEVMIPHYIMEKKL